MPNSTEVLSQYLVSENIHIDKKEFDYQLSSHPDFPSLLSISDTLTFFKINNAAIKVSKEKFDLLPNSFLANLKGNQGDFLSFVNKNDETVTYTSSDDKPKISTIAKQEFFNKWDGVVLLAENDEDTVKTHKKRRFGQLQYLFIFAGTIALLLFFGLENYSSILFGIFPLMGIWLSVYALNDIFQTESKILSKVCESGPSSGCNTIVNSNKWKIFDVISFSDISIMFFSLQFFALFIFGVLNKYDNFFSLQALILGLSIPVILTSLYYQKFVEKKWCTICLSIILVLILEMVYIVVFTNLQEFTIPIRSIALFGFLALSVFLVWNPLKKMLTDNKEFKESELKANRFKRNYQLFKNTFITENKNQLPNSLLKFGNTNAKVKISILTSPFCGYCLKPHKALKELLEKFGDSIEISIVLNVHENDERYNTIAKNLIQLSLNKGPQAYYEAMDDWYEHKDLEKWLKKFKVSSIDDKIAISLKEQNAWCTKSSYNFTPCLFVNGRKYPDLYDVDDLQFFIEELSEDTTLY